MAEVPAGREGPRPGAQRGSVLLLVPAAVLVLFILGAIAVDAAVAFMAQRELTAAAAAAANDAAGAAMSDGAFYEGDGATPAGSIDIDDAAARRLALRALAARAPRGVTISDDDVDVAAPGRQVCVAVTGRVDNIFARAVPGAPTTRTVHGRAVATAVEGPAGRAVPSRSLC